MFKEKIEELLASIDDTSKAISSHTTLVREALDANDLEKARALKGELDQMKAELATQKADLALFEEQMEGANEPKAEGSPVKVEGEEMNYRDNVNAFLHSKGTVVNEGLKFAEPGEVIVPMNALDGIKKADTKPVTSEEIVTTPIREVKTVVDLKPFTTVYGARKGSGKYPILKRATAKMASVAELEKNPDLAKPEFDSVAWEVQTYRGAIPVSQESIDDADVDLLAIVSEAAQQIKVNTTNAAIADVLKTFEAKTAADLDAIKAILNVDLDPAYEVSFIVSQSFYQALDTLKDKNGRYLLQDSIVSASGKVFLGHPVFVVADEALGNAGEAHAFIGDVKRGVLFADRAELGLRWTNNEIYGQYLQAVVRFDVKKADAKAGYFVTYTP